jgi:hypothetical protein
MAEATVSYSTTILSWALFKTKVILSQHLQPEVLKPTDLICKIIHKVITSLTYFRQNMAG